MIDEGKDGDRNFTSRQLRKTRLLQSAKSRAIDSQVGDLPTFLINSDLAVRMGDSGSRFSAEKQVPLSASLRNARAAVALRYLGAKDRLDAIRARQIPMSLLSRRGTLGIFGIALIASVLPLVLFIAPERASQIGKKADPIYQTLLPLPPEFELEKRLAFAAPLIDRLLANAVEQSFEQSTRSGPNGESAGSIELDTNLMSEPQTSAEDQNLSLPFNSQGFSPANLPKTSRDSFVAELAMSDLMNARVERPLVAENDAPATTSSPKIKPRKVAARKRVVALKKRPAQVNQLTASAAPLPAVQQQPNLPPPPILFFLGAPPPQSSQP